MKRKLLAIVGLALFFLPTNSGADPFVGIASWYSESDPGINLRTANGEIFDDSKWTCASWDFPFNTYLRVTHLANGKTVLCRVNDRGPAKRLGRAIDLTQAAFRGLAPLRLGLIHVKVEVAYKTQSRPEGFLPK